METFVKKDRLFPSVVNKSMNTLFDDFFSTDIIDWTDKNNSTLGTSLPSVNLKETDIKIVIELAAPGRMKEDFKVAIENNLLIISCEKGEEKEDTKKENVYRREFNHQSFDRSFNLPKYI